MLPYFQEFKQLENRPRSSLLHFMADHVMLSSLTWFMLFVHIRASRSPRSTIWDPHGTRLWNSLRSDLNARCRNNRTKRNFPWQDTVPFLESLEILFPFCEISMLNKIQRMVMSKRLRNWQIMLSTEWSLIETLSYYRFQLETKLFFYDFWLFINFIMKMLQIFYKHFLGSVNCTLMVSPQQR